jgi:hypothetical protein
MRLVVPARMSGGSSWLESADEVLWQRIGVVL